MGGRMKQCAALIVDCDMRSSSPHRALERLGFRVATTAEWPGDDMIRDRVAFKLQLLIFDQIHVAQPTEDQLRGWFARNHTRFDEQERVGFYLTPPTDQTTAQRQLDEILGQHESEELQKQTRAILGRPVASLAESFGEGFRSGLLAMPQGEWNILQSKEGWHVVRLDSRRSGTLASF